MSLAPRTDVTVRQRHSRCGPTTVTSAATLAKGDDTSRILWRRSGDGFVQCVGDRLVSLLRGVLVDERRAGRCVAHPRHELSRGCAGGGRRASLRCDGGRGSAARRRRQLCVTRRHAVYRLPRRNGWSFVPGNTYPSSPGPAQWASCSSRSGIKAAGIDTVRTPAAVLGGASTRLPSLSSWSWPATCTVACSRLRCLRVERRSSPRRSEVKVAVSTARGTSDRSRRRARVDLLDGRDRPLLGVLDTGAADATRVLLEHVVVDRGCEDGAQKPVALRGGRRTRARAAQQAGVPRADHRGLEVGKGDRTERRQDVEAQEALVELGGARPQERALTQPARGVVGERDGGGVDVDPCARARWPSGWSRNACACRAVENVCGARCSTLPRRIRAWNRPDGKRRTLPHGLRRVIATCSRDEQVRAHPGEMWHEVARARVGRGCTAARRTRDQVDAESGRRESNSRSQLGKLMFCR